MRQNVIGDQAYANLRIYAVWVPFVGGSQDAIDLSILGDAHVTQYWDGGAITSDWFEQNVTKNGFPTYDIYFLYGAEARWKAIPDPLVSSGTTVIGQSDQLLSALASQGSGTG